MKTTSFLHKFHSKGFTLLELIVVMSVLGVLASVVLLIVDPAEQLARGRDTNRLQLVSQLGHAIQAYYFVEGELPTPNTEWQQTLKNSKEITNTQAAPSGATPVCNTFPVGEICYTGTGTEFLVWTTAESQQYKNRAAGDGDPCTTLGLVAYIIYMGAQGKAGVACSGEPIGSVALN